MPPIRIAGLVAALACLPGLATAKAVAVSALLSEKVIGPDDTDGFDAGERNLIQAIAAEPDNHGMSRGKYLVLPPDAAPTHGAEVDVLDMVASREFHCAPKGTYWEGHVLAAKAFVKIIPGPAPHSPEGMTLVRVVPPACDGSDH